MLLQCIYDKKCNRLEDFPLKGIVGRASSGANWIFTLQPLNRYPLNFINTLPMGIYDCPTNFPVHWKNKTVKGPKK